MDKQSLQQNLDLLQNAWEVIGNKKIRYEFEFKSFADAMKFVNNIARVAEKHDHHPDIRISYNRVGIELTTHEEDDLTAKDFRVARDIETVEK
jgi:4a-hydroxytetrahydrobiopterin dehydratase